MLVGIGNVVGDISVFWNGLMLIETAWVLLDNKVMVSLDSQIEMQSHTLSYLRHSFLLARSRYKHQHKHMHMLVT